MNQISKLFVAAAERASKDEKKKELFGEPPPRGRRMNFERWRVCWWPGAEGQQIVGLHVVNHVTRSRDEVHSNNLKLKKDQGFPAKDQGFTRCKVASLLKRRREREEEKEDGGRVARRNHEDDVCG
eukprot:747274-Hanusia_phi.AAC.3